MDARDVSARQGVRRLDHAAGRRPTLRSRYSTSTRRRPDVPADHRISRRADRRPRRRRRRRYGRPVSFGIRRCEFDHYLLQRSGARLRARRRRSTSIRRDGAAVDRQRRDPRRRCWSAPAVTSVRWRDRSTARPIAAPVVVAQEAEFPIDPRDAAAFAIDGETPELYFCRDLKGYGWCFRKEDYLNVGLGRLDRRSLPARDRRVRRVSRGAGARSRRHASWRWRGHAYAVYGPSLAASSTTACCWSATRRASRIRRAARGSGRRSNRDCSAAVTIVEANGQYTSDRLEPYEDRLQARFGTGPVSRALARICRPASGPRPPGACWRCQPSCATSCSTGGSSTLARRR